MEITQFHNLTESIRSLQINAFEMHQVLESLLVFVLLFRSVYPSYGL